jgi:hypothetical protein
MNSITNIIYHITYNGVTQNQGVQEALLGGFLINQGKKWLFSPNKPSQAPDSTTLKDRIMRVTKKIVGAGCLISGGYLLYSGGSHLQAKGAELIEYLKGDYPKGFHSIETDHNPFEDPAPSQHLCIKKDEYHSLCTPSPERNAAQQWGSEILSLNPKDSRPKVLFLSAASDAEDIANGEIRARRLIDLVGNPNEPRPLTCAVDFLNHHFDLKYKLISHPLQMCHEVAEASKTTPLSGLILLAHSNPSVSVFGDPPDSKLRVFDPRIPHNCLDGLTAEAPIIHLGCEAGGQSRRPINIAAWLAALSQRKVIASTQNVNPYGIFMKADPLSIEFRDVRAAMQNPFSSAESQEPSWEFDMCHLPSRVPANRSDNTSPHSAPCSAGCGVDSKIFRRQLKRE